jgi:GR25 family glycosyltransferase involved in LPS biosynthesis
VPVQVVHGVNTRDVETARSFEDKVHPAYMKQALKMHWNPKEERPDITYFNLGAIGAMIGHLEIHELAKRQGVKYALILEDNVVVKDDRFFREVEDVLETLGDDFEMCFFHCHQRLSDGDVGTLEKVKWISGMKAYLVNVDNMLKFHEYFFPMDNHIDNKIEDLISRGGARVFYKHMEHCISVDRTGGSTIGHSAHAKKDFFSRQHPHLDTRALKQGW